MSPPLEPDAELLQEEGTHHPGKVGRLDQRPHVHDGGDGGKDPDKAVEYVQTNAVVPVIAICAGRNTHVIIRTYIQ